MGRDDKRNEKHRRHQDDSAIYKSKDATGLKDRDRDRRRDGTHKDGSRRRSKREEGRSNDDESSLDEKRQRHRKRHKRRDEKGDESRTDEDESSTSRRHRKKRSYSRRDEDRRTKKDRKYHDKHDKKKDKKASKKEKRRDQDHSEDEKPRKKTKKSKDHTEPKTDKSSLFPMGDPLGRTPDTLIQPETDYFTYHQEFWVYLYREEGVRFNDLTSEEAREAFARFSKQYNAGKLEAPYYDNPPTFPPQVLDESKTTKHKWGFQTSETERRGLEMLQEGVRRLTQYKDEGANQEFPITGKSDATKASTRSTQHDVDSLDSGKPQDGRSEALRINRRLREHVRTAQEEITGGAKDFRERQIEKRQEQATRIHGASRDKEEGAALELNDADVYGDGDTSFRQALARERDLKKRREEKRLDRVAELQNKEKERQENMLKVLGIDGLKPGQKISIAPRQD